MSRLRSLFCVLLAVVLAAAVALPSLPAAVAAVPALVGSAGSTSAMLGSAPVVALPSLGIFEALWTRAKDTAVAWVSRLLDVVFAEGDSQDDPPPPAEPDGPVPNSGVMMFPEG